MAGSYLILLAQVGRPQSSGRPSKVIPGPAAWQRGPPEASGPATARCQKTRLARRSFDVIGRKWHESKGGVRSGEKPQGAEAQGGRHWLRASAEENVGAAAPAMPSPALQVR